MQKTDSLMTIKLIDTNKKEIGWTYPKRAKGLVKKERAKYIDETTIMLLSPTLEDNKMSLEENKKGLRKISIPKYTLGEELLSAITHGIGALLSIAGMVLCIIIASIHKDAYAIVASCIYGVTSIVLYLMSTLYHSFAVNNAKRVFRIIDHCSIYLLIAGTYTPYALVTLREANPLVGWTIFAANWTCAILGIVFTSIDMNKFKKMGMALYLIMGWMVIFTFKTLLQNMAIQSVYLMLAAGIIYTIGAIIYGIGKKIKYMHGVFHIFVLAASILFFFSILFYVV